MNKKLLLESVNNDTAKFIEEQWITKDCWEQLYEFKGVQFYVNVHTDSRWVEEDPDMITIV